MKVLFICANFILVAAQPRQVHPWLKTFAPLPLCVFALMPFPIRVFRVHSWLKKCQPDLK
jgi:hypothetical protein